METNVTVNGPTREQFKAIILATMLEWNGTTEADLDIEAMIEAIDVRLISQGDNGYIVQPE